MKFIFLILTSLLSSCSLVSVRTNLPFFYGHREEIVNSSSYRVELAMNGVPLTLEDAHGSASAFLEPTGTALVKFPRNYTGTTVQATITMKAWRRDGAYVGAASHSRYLWTEQSTSQSVILTDAGITSCGSLLCRWQGAK